MSWPAVLLLQRKLRGGVAGCAAAAVSVAEDAKAPVNAAVPASAWDKSELLLTSLSDSTEKLISAAYTARQWFNTQSPDCAVLPDLSAALFYRPVLFCDIEARIAVKVVCSLYTEVPTVAWVACGACNGCAAISTCLAAALRHGNTRGNV